MEIAVGTGLAKAIRESMDSRSTDELLALWTANDHVQLSDDAFRTIEQLLTERGVTLPRQNPPVLSYPDPHPLKVNGRYTRATGVDIVVSILLPGCGVIVGLIAFAKREERRGLTMLLIGAGVILILLSSRR